MQPRTTSSLSDATASDTMSIQEYDGQPVEKQTLVKKTAPTDWYEGFVDSLDTLPRPGIQDIKWVELYAKYAKLIPEEKRSEWRYYNEDPGPEIRSRVSKNSMEAKAIKRKRTSTGSTSQKVSKGRKSAENHSDF
jgi:hypothetical protein